jgi:hypothetical protein
VLCPGGQGPNFLCASDFPGRKGERSKGALGSLDLDCLSSPELQQEGPVDANARAALVCGRLGGLLKLVEGG